jgi:site-specific recombinase XerC
MRNRADNTSKAYAYSLGVWLNFLQSAGLNWQETTEDEVEAFQFWRLTDPRNGQPVEASSFARDVAACKSFYRWVGKRHAVVNPFEDYEPPRSRKGADVKWLDPAAATRWIDVGLRGRVCCAKTRAWLLTSPPRTLHLRIRAVARSATKAVAMPSLPGGLRFLARCGRR